MALFYKAANPRSAQRLRAQAKISGPDEAGATEKSQPRTFRAKRYSLRKKVAEKGAEDVELDPLQTRTRPAEVALSVNSTLRNE